MIHNKIVRPSFLIVQYVLQLVLVLFRFVLICFKFRMIFCDIDIGKAKQVRLLLMPHIYKKKFLTIKSEAMYKLRK